MVAMLSLASYNGLMPAEQLKKSCIDPNGRPLEAAIKRFAMTYAVFFGGVPVVSAGAIAALGSAPLRHSVKEFKGISSQLGKGLLKTTRFTAPAAVVCHTVQRNLAE